MHCMLHLQTMQKKETVQASHYTEQSTEHRTAMSLCAMRPTWSFVAQCTLHKGIGFTKHVEILNMFIFFFIFFFLSRDRGYVMFFWRSFTYFQMVSTFIPVFIIPTTCNKLYIKCSLNLYLLFYSLHSVLERWIAQVGLNAAVHSARPSTVHAPAPPWNEPIYPWNVQFAMYIIAASAAVHCSM